MKNCRLTYGYLHKNGKQEIIKIEEYDKNGKIIKKRRKSK
jgi:hypothetical protein